MSILNKPQGENNEIQTMCKKLKDMRGNVEEIKTKIKENIDKFNKNVESLKMAINNYILFLKAIIKGNQDINNIKKQNDLTEDIRKNIKLFFDSVINISYSKNLNIIESRTKIYNLFDEFIKYDFFPNENGVFIHFKSNESNELSLYSDNQNISQNRMNLFNDINEVGEKEEENTLRENSINKSSNGICSLCNNKASCFYLNKKYCEKCINDIVIKMLSEGKTFNFEDIIHFDNQKELFISSFETLIKIILLKCNYILKNESKISINTENHIGKNIKRKFKYPSIKSDEYRDVNFMSDINSVLTSDFNADFQNFSEKNFDLINLSELIKDSLKNIFKNIFKDEKIFNDDKINNIGSNHNNMMEDDLIEIDPNSNNYDINIDNIKNEHFVKNENNILKDYYLLINLIPKKQDSSKVKLEKEIIQTFNKNLSLNKDDILFSYNRSYFIDRLIKTEKFDNLSQYFFELYEFKNIIDELLIRFCNIDRKLINYKGHFIIPNKSNNFIRGKEKYYPPYGWFGIGLNVLGKYENDEWINDNSKESKWSIAYHGVGGNLPSSEVIKKLRKKIINGLEDGESQYKCNYSDIRHINKRIGTGVYLTPNINIAEDYSGEISFNNSKYKIALMVKVLNAKIREPEDINFWILHRDYVRIYRVLIKKIKE